MIQLYPGVTIIDEKKFVESHEKVIKHSKSKLICKLHQERLEDYYKLKNNGKET